MSPRPAVAPGDPVRIADPKFNRLDVYRVKSVDDGMVEVELGNGSTATLARASIRTLNASELERWRNPDPVAEPVAASEVTHNSARNNGHCACGHVRDQHYLRAPEPCAVGGCECKGYDLGRSVAAAAPDPNAVAVRLPIDNIDRSPLNPRKHFPQEALQELAASLEADGLLQPIVVTPAGERYVIVAGERRWRAAKLLGWTEITAIIRTDVDDATHIRLALLENLVRTDLDPLEEAEGYRQLQELGMTQAAIAAAVHRSQPAIANAIRLLRAPHEILDRLEAGELSKSHVLALLQYEQFPAIMRHVAEVVVEEAIPSKELESGLPDAFTLVQEGLARDLNSYRANFDTKVCEACPFDARVKSGLGYGGGSFYCLKPEHYDELQAEADKKRQGATQRQLEKAKASGKQLPKIDNLKYGTFERLGSRAPEGCSEACTCRGAAIGYSGEVEQICTDPKQFNKLRTAATRKENLDRKKQLTGLLDRLNDKLELVEEIGERELAVLVTAALSNFTGPDLREAVKWSGGLLELKDLEDYRERDALPRKLAALAPRDLVRVGVYAVLHHELRNALQGYGTGAKPRADWYLADQPPRPTGKPLVEAFSADDHLADEIAAERERLGHESVAEMAGVP